MRTAARRLATGGSFPGQIGSLTDKGGKIEVCLVGAGFKANEDAPVPMVAPRARLASCSPPWFVISGGMVIAPGENGLPTQSLFDKK
jgi:hypothetical protein